MNCIPCNAACRDPSGREPGDSQYSTCHALTGNCRGCEAKHYGPSCEPCSTNCETCSDTPSGNGDCITCPADKFGVNCDKPCPVGCPGQCQNDPTQASEVAGNGLCVSCPTDRATPDCSVSCPSGCDSTTTGGICDAGVNGNGACTKCPTGYWGKECDNKCTCEHGTCDDGYASTFSGTYHPDFSALANVPAKVDTMV